MYFKLHDWLDGLPFLAQVSIWLTGNLTLAAIPVAIARWMKAGVERDIAELKRLRWGIWVPAAGLWLLFLPNTAYLLTEWRHYLATVAYNPAYHPVIMGEAYPADATRNLVFLTVFFGLYSLSGLVALVKAVQPVDFLLLRYAKRARSWSIPALFLLCSVGVYLGLVDRLNSWDLFNARTAIDIGMAPVRIATSPWLATMIGAFAVFLWLVYLFAARRFGDGRDCGAAAG